MFLDEHYTLQAKARDLLLPNSKGRLRCGFGQRTELRLKLARDGEPQIGNVVNPSIRVLRETAAHEGHQHRRCDAGKLRPVGLALQHLGQHLRSSVSDKRCPTSEHLDENHTK